MLVTALATARPPNCWSHESTPLDCVTAPGVSASALG